MKLKVGIIICDNAPKWQPLLEPIVKRYVYSQRNEAEFIHHFVPQFLLMNSYNLEVKKHCADAWGGGANGEMANLTNEKGKFAIAIFRHFSPFFAIFRHW